MARLFCQVIFKPARITVVWSEGKVPFEPYHLEGEEVPRLENLGRAARRRLAQAMHGGEDLNAAGELADLGRQLYRALFRLDKDDPASREVYLWWKGQRKQVQSLDILSNSPGRIPWNLVCEEFVPGELDGPIFWGFRYSLGVGRRVSPLFANINNPGQTALLLIEGEKQRGLADWARDNQLPLTSAREEFKEALRERIPDLLYLSGELNRGQVQWAGQSLALEEMRDILRDTQQGNPYPVQVLALHGPATGVDHWECFVGSASTDSSAVVLPEVPLPPEALLATAQGFVKRMLAGNAELGEALRLARIEGGLAGLAWSAQAPAGLGFSKAETPDGDYPEAPPRPMPEIPYCPFQPLDQSRRMFLAGRQLDMIRCALVLDGNAPHGLLIHGPSGAGKSSFLQAGLLPFLEEESVGFQALRDRSEPDVPLEDLPFLTLRAGRDPLGTLCQGIALLAAHPLEYQTPANKRVRLEFPAPPLRTSLVPETSKAIQSGSLGGRAGVSPPSSGAESATLTTGEDTEQWAMHLYRLAQHDPDGFLKAFDELTQSLPRELIVVLEQAEDLTQGLNEKDRRARARSLELLSRLATSSARCRIILTVRGDQVGPLLDLLPPELAQTAWREYYLPPLSEDDLEVVLFLPTATEPLTYGSDTPHTHYQFFIEDGLSRTLIQDVVQAAGKHQLAPLPLLHCVANELYQKMRSRNDNTLRSAHLKAVGAVPDLPPRSLDNGIIKQGLTPRMVHPLLDNLIKTGLDGLPHRELVPYRTLAVSFPGGETSLDAATASLTEANPPLIEAVQLLHQGRLEPFLTLPNDTLAQARNRGRAVSDMKAYGLSQVVDTLWIMIPLVALAAALAFFFTRRLDSTSRQQEIEEAKKEFILEIQKELEVFQKQEAQKFKRVEDISLNANYLAHLAGAREALREGNLLQVRADLIATQPLADSKGKANSPDLRGFDWYHLWRRLHPERHALLGHPAPISGVALSPDGKLAASASLDGTLKLWDTDSLSEIQSIPGDGVGILSITFAGDGKHLLLGRKDKTVQSLAIAGDKDGIKVDSKSSVWKGHDAEVLSVASAEGHSLISADQGGKVITWDSAKGVPGATFIHKGTIRGITFGPDKMLALIGEGGQVWLYDPAKGSDPTSVETPLMQAEALASDPKRVRLAVGGSVGAIGSGTGMVVILDEKGKLIGSPLKLASQVRSLTWARDGQSLIIGTRDHALHVWDSKKPSVERTLRSHLGWVNSLAAGPNGMVLSGGQDAHIKVWSLAPDFEPEVLHGHKSAIVALAFSPNARILASGDETGLVRFQEAATGKLLHEMNKEGTVIFAQAPGKEGRKLAIAWTSPKGSGGIVLADLEGGKDKLVPKQILGPEKEIVPQALAMSGDAAKLFIADREGRLFALDMVGEPSLKALGTIKEKITVLKVAGADLALLAGTEGGDVLTLDAGSGKILASAKEHAGPVRSLVVLPGSGEVHRFLTWGNDQMLRTWVGSKDILRSDLSHHRPTAGEGGRLILGGTSMLLVNGAGGRGIQLGRLIASGLSIQERGYLEGATVGPVAIGQDESIIAGGCPDGTIRLWRAATESETLHPRPR